MCSLALAVLRLDARSRLCLSVPVWGVCLPARPGAGRGVCVYVCVGSVAGAGTSGGRVSPR